VRLDDLFAEIWVVLATVPGLRVPVDGLGLVVGPPSPYVELPEVTYGEYGPGLDRIPDLGLTVVFGPANNAQTFREALQYASTSGAKSIPAILAGHAWFSCHTLRAGRAEPVTLEPRDGNPLLGYVFHLDISGAP
jgi:hypothetical protein